MFSNKRRSGTSLLSVYNMVIKMFTKMFFTLSAEHKIIIVRSACFSQNWNIVILVCAKLVAWRMATQNYCGMNTDPKHFIATDALKGKEV